MTPPLPGRRARVYASAMHPTLETKLPIRLDALHDAAAVDDPFDFVYVPRFIAGDAFDRVHDDFPLIEKAGSYPVDFLSYGPGFGALVAGLESPEMRRAVEQKFALDLTGR